MIRCNNCMAVYQSKDDLSLLWDDGEAFKGCKTCNTDMYLIDIEDDEREAV